MIDNKHQDLLHSIPDELKEEEIMKEYQMKVKQEFLKIKRESFQEKYIKKLFQLELEARFYTYNNGSDRKFSNDLRKIVKIIIPREKVIGRVSITAEEYIQYQESDQNNKYTVLKQYKNDLDDVKQQITIEITRYDYTKRI